MTQNIVAFHEHRQAFRYFGWQFLFSGKGILTQNILKVVAFHEHCLAFLYYDWQFLFSGKKILTQNTHCQAFRYFGWLTMAPLLVLHCLLCCTAFQMGDNTLSWNHGCSQHDELTITHINYG